MKAHLMFEDKDFALDIAYTYRSGFTVSGPDLPPRSGDVAQDLELVTMLETMASGDHLLFEVAKFALLTSLTEPSEIAYRQQILSDCIEHPEIPRQIYQIAAEAILRESRIYQPFDNSPSGVLRRAVEALETFVELLHRLRGVADEHGTTVSSGGMTTLFSMLQHELDDEYFATIADHLARLKFRDGTLMSAQLGRQNRGTNYVLRSPGTTKRSWRERIGMDPRNALHFELHPRDEAGARMLGELNNRGVNLVANALAQSTDHILSFFKLLCGEIAFYVGCLNLHDRLEEKGVPTCTPDPVAPDDLALTYRGIYDVALALRASGPIVGNDGDADHKTLVMITGANSGGKSTLLRSLGQAQLMLQCGMFVGAGALRASTTKGLFTHFIREEDDTMSSGKLDEEMARMSAIAKFLGPRTIVLFNESFAATNEREGSEIARQIIDALVESEVRVLFVTHQFALGDTFYSRHCDQNLFLRAERADDGRRTYRLLEGEPLPTSFGEDLYRRIGGWSGSDEPAAAGAAASAAAAPGVDAPVGAAVGAAEGDGAEETSR